MSLSVCKFYSLNQTCRFGKNCRYSHSSQRPPPDLHTPNQKNEDSVNYLQTAVSLSEDISNFNPEPKKENESTVDTRFCSHSTVENTASRSITRSHAEDSAVNRKSEPPQGNSNICRHFARTGNCYYGKNCRFVHSTYGSARSDHSHGRRGRSSYGTSRPSMPPRFRTEETAVQPSGREPHDPDNLSDSHEALTVKQESQASSSPHESEASTEKPQSQNGERKVCAFFKARRCKWGRNCKFLHSVRCTRGEGGETIKDNIDEGKKDEPYVERTPQEKPAQKTDVGSSGRVVRPSGIGGRQVLTFEELEEYGHCKVREGDVNAIKRRFPQDKITILEDDDSKFSARIIFTPSDPDWPFDVKTFEFVLTLPTKYPEVPMSVKLPGDQNMPETIRRYVEISINEWLQERAEIMKGKGKVELVFRGFLRWLDRSIEEITTEALKQLKRELVAKAAGMEFLSPSQLREKLKGEASDSGEDSEESTESEDEDGSSSEDEDYSEDSDDDEEEEQPSVGLNLDPEKKGTQVELRHLQLRENASALLLDRLKLVVQCGRCKNHADLQLPQSKVMSMTCFKCNQNQFAHYRASLAHQFSSIVGYLDLDGCQAFDLVLQDCRAVVTCLGCSKLTRVDGLVAGQMIDGWCQACHAKFKIATETVKFTQLAPTVIDRTAQHQKVDAPKPRKAPKDPAIREGYPLPEFGTCKHYKQSYRWLRFPCCGKAYPCDICHDKKEDHEHVFATRMICGHCCKEQNYSASRPCNSCSQHMTKIRSAHWEGGKGCRDKISMSKNDHAKYRNQSKTTSNHKKQVQNKGKKITKLRRV